LVIMLIKSDGTNEILSSLAFGVGLTILYLSSTLFHSFPEKMKRVYSVFQRFDHASIFILITGTYTPFLVLAVDSLKGYILLGVLWFLTILGVVFKSIWVSKFHKFHVIIYLIMGWSVLFVMGDVISAIETGFVYLLLGGLSYTIGVVFYVVRFKYNHFVWHIFVLVGSMFHFIAVMGLLI